MKYGINTKWIKVTNGFALTKSSLSNKKWKTFWMHFLKELWFSPWYASSSSQWGLGLFDVAFEFLYLKDFWIFSFIRNSSDLKLDEKSDNLTTIGGRWYFDRAFGLQRLTNQWLYSKILLLQKFNDIGGKVFNLFIFSLWHHGGC